MPAWPGCHGVRVLGVRVAVEGLIVVIVGFCFATLSALPFPAVRRCVRVPIKVGTVVVV